jgi:hypothetical protein
MARTQAESASRRSPVRESAAPSAAPSDPACPERLHVAEGERRGDERDQLAGLRILAAVDELHRIGGPALLDLAAGADPVERLAQGLLVR